MTNDIEQLITKTGLTLTVGHFAFGLFGQATESPKRAVHDGDTVVAPWAG